MNFQIAQSLKYSNTACRPHRIKYSARGSQLHQCRKSKVYSQNQINQGDIQENSDISQQQILVAEDAAAFDINNQSRRSWIYFFIVLATVLAILYVAWISPSTGYSTQYLRSLEALTNNSSLVLIELMLVFGVCHSGLAFLRPYGEKLIGKRAYRVLFASVSLPLAVTTIVYFINHRYDGGLLWNVKEGGALQHNIMWAINFISFWLLYPSTFNILEVAAVDQPKLHIYETGVLRITRHPQLWGQLLWCMAHTYWIASPFMVTTTATLMLYHMFGAWHGDFRLKREHGELFDQVKSRTSIIPFKAILDGRQKLPSNYLSEFARVPYLVISLVTIGAYYAHPLMMEYSLKLPW